MKQIKIKGKLKKDLKQQLDRINANKSAMGALAESTHRMEKKLWRQIMREFPGMSEHGNLKSEDGKLILTDRLRGKTLHPLDHFSKKAGDTTGNEMGPHDTTT